ncbi:MAG: glycosyltransferase family 4 protein [Colwellia sp.]
MTTKVLYVCTRPPFPKIGGREHMIAQSLEFLAVEFDVHVVCFHGKNETVDKGPVFDLGVSSVCTVVMATPYNVFKNLFFRFGMSIQENLYFSPAVKGRLEAVLEDIKPDIVVCDMLRTAQFFYGNELPLVIDLDDILSIRYKKMLQGGAKYSSLGTFSERIPSTLRWLEALARKWVIKFEYSRIKKAEKKAIHCADALILTSPLEARELNRSNSTKKAVGISQCVQPTGGITASGNDLIFIGNMTTAQNLASLEFIVDEVLPELELGGLKLKVVGKFDERAVKIAENSESVYLLGFVDNLSVVVSECRVALMPVAFGTGVKTKVLDALAMGVPVVTNSIGAEGLSIVHREHALIEESGSALAGCVNDIIANSFLSESLAKKGRTYVTDHHSFNSLKEKYNSVIRSLLNVENSHDRNQSSDVC